MSATFYVPLYTRNRFQKLCVTNFQIILHDKKVQDIVKFIAFHLKQNHFPISKHNTDIIIK